MIESRRSKGFVNLMDRGSKDEMDEGGNEDDNNLLMALWLEVQSCNHIL